jgi:hypothetical protein
MSEFRGFESENQRLADERAECETFGYTLADQRESYEQWKRTLVHADKVHGLFIYGDVAARHEQDHRGGYNGAPWQHDVTDLFLHADEEDSR